MGVNITHFLIHTATFQKERKEKKTDPIKNSTQLREIKFKKIECPSWVVETRAWILFISEVWADNCDKSVDAEFLKLLELIELLIMNMGM